MNERVSTAIGTRTPSRTPSRTPPVIEIEIAKKHKKHNTPVQHTNQVVVYITNIISSYIYWYYIQDAGLTEEVKLFSNMHCCPP